MTTPKKPRMRVELDAMLVKHSIFRIGSEESSTPRKSPLRAQQRLSPKQRNAKDSVSPRKSNAKDTVSSKKRKMKDVVPPKKRNVQDSVSPKRRKSNDGKHVTMHLTPPALHPALKPRMTRSLKPLPDKLLTQVTYEFEERLYRDALNLTARALESGLETDAPARIPPHQHIALASNLSVHPNFNTRTNKKANRADSNHALRYLRQLTRTVEPQDADLHKAFKYGLARGQRSKRARARKSEMSSDDDDEVLGKIDNKLAKEGSLWNNTEDFWSAVGWAFNCSVKHKARWERWAAWLGQILDVLQRDLDWHVAMEARTVDIAESMLAQYLSTIDQGRNNQRRVMRAILADGSKTSMGEFHEVWRNETRPPKKKRKEEHTSIKSKRLDIDNGQFGDYFDNDSDEESEVTRQPRSTPTAAAASRPRQCNIKIEARSCSEEDNDEGELSSDPSDHHSVEAFGGLQSVQLRQRFFVLLAQFSSKASHLFLETSDLFSVFAECIRPLPVPVFQQFVLPTKPYLDSDSQASLNEMLFQSFLGTGQPSCFVTKDVLATNYAPYAAISTSTADNVKVGLLTESLLRSLWKSGSLDDDFTALQAAIDKGIQARDAKVSWDGRKKACKRAAADEEAKVVLRSSAGRMRVLLELARGHPTMPKPPASSFEVLAHGSSLFDCSVCDKQDKNVEAGDLSIVRCGSCSVGQHTKCHGFSPEQAESKDLYFVCEKCKIPTSVY